MIDPDIRRAWSLPAEAYFDPQWYRHELALLRRSWHVIATAEELPAPGHVHPLTLLPGSLDEPLVLTRDDAGGLHCLSNVCTHRGNLVVTNACKAANLRCGYHGRRFELDGRFAGMPEFEAALDFPSPADDLPRVAIGRLGPLLFASLEPEVPFDELVAPFRKRLGALLDAELVFDADSSRDYEVRASWALYCDNYLEGFHIPFVHAGLAGEIDYGQYETELLPFGSLQVGIASPKGSTLALPPDHPDAGRRIAGLYAWLFPATMLNVYPWGWSVNLVRPLGPERSRVSFLSFVGDESQVGRGAGADLHRVELEDEQVVERVQQGVRSRLYRRGRFSPARETGVHHFHRLLEARLPESLFVLES
jgi:choline monooxygenase